MRLDTQNRDLCERLALSEGRERALLAAFDRLEAAACSGVGVVVVVPLAVVPAGGAVGGGILIS